MPAHDNIARNADPDVGWFVSFQAPDGNPFGVLRTTLKRSGFRSAIRSGRVRLRVVLSAELTSEGGRLGFGPRTEAKGGPVKKYLPVFAVVALLLPTAAQARFTLGGPEPPYLNIAGQAKFGIDYDLEAAEMEPFLSFNNASISMFLTGRLTPKLDYFFHHSFTNGKYTIYECYVRWQVFKLFSLTAGQSKAPFGRVYNSSAARLLFKNRNPLAGFAPQYQVGLRPELELFDSKVSVHAGVYNGNGRNVSSNPDPYFMYTGCVHIAPLGPVAMEESAHEGYDSPVFAVVPGVYVNPMKVASGERQVDSFATTYGGHAAVRWDYFALDAAYYMCDLDHQLNEQLLTSSGMTVQAGYAIEGKLEPVVRFSIIDPDDARENDTETIIEAGLNYYFNGYASRLGLNFLASTRQVPRPEGAESVTTSELRLYYEMQY